LIFKKQRQVILADAIEVGKKILNMWGFDADARRGTSLGGILALERMGCDFARLFGTKSVFEFCYGTDVQKLSRWRKKESRRYW